MILILKCFKWKQNTSGSPFGWFTIGSLGVGEVLVLVWVKTFEIAVLFSNVGVSSNYYPADVDEDVPSGWIF